VPSSRSAVASPPDYNAADPLARAKNSPTRSRCHMAFAAKFEAALKRSSDQGPAIDRASECI
jgi:hypothetical protein